jgi:tetratricopeptide (TPR) repeat protein
MLRPTFFRSLSVGACALAVALIAAPAFAQLTANAKGMVVDETGKGVEADLLFKWLGEINREATVKANAKGEWLKAGLAPGAWKVTATTKDGRMGATNINLTLGEINKIPNIVVKAVSASAAKAATMSAKEIEAENKKQVAMEADFNAAKLAFDSGDYDGAVAGLERVLVNLPNCAACYASIGDAHNKKGDLVKAEAAYLKSIEMDAKKAAPYAALATIYNGQKKFKEAGEMSAKANELSEASGGGGDASSVYNQGVILWNQQKAPEAEALFEKATKLDPTMADAFYWLGMARVNQGKLPEAKAPLQEYMKLKPTGEHAETVKGLLAVIK